MAFKMLPKNVINQLLGHKNEELDSKEKEKKEKEFKTKPLPPKITRTASEEQSKQFKELSSLLSESRIEVIQVIGTGSYSNVYFGLNLKLLKQQAIKVIDVKKASDNYRLKFLRKEINVMQRVKHPNIIRIYDIMQTDNKIIVVMKFALIGTLADFVKTNGAFSETDSQRIFKSIVDGLRYMHALNFAHRDMKANNILLSKNFVPILSDFSHSRQLECEPDSKVKLSTTFCGSIPYFPPQILQLQPYCPLKYDIWSTGVILYIILFNQFPFDPQNEIQMLSNQLNRKWSYKTSITDSAKDILEKMLEPDEDRRCNTTDLYLHVWVRNVEPMSRTNFQ